jgi:hypothetical protein
MAAKYLLPCSCGQNLTVELRQAGENVVCACGKSLEVPTLLQLKKLVQVVEEEKAPRFAWRAGHGWILLGICILLGDLGLSFLFVWEPPQSPFSGKSPEVIHEMVQNLPPSESWKLWQYFRKNGLSTQEDWIKRNYLERLAVYQALWALLIPIFLVGASFIVAGIVILRRRNRRVARGRAPPQSRSA